MILEVIAISADDAATAVACGADRIELVTGIAEGGLTPSAGLIEAAVREAGVIPVQVMIRPHSQSFCYSDRDIAVMLQDIHLVKQTGANGIVIGALSLNGTIHIEHLAALLAAADGLDVTFHRAFDAVIDQHAALKQLSRYPQIRRVLTSGGRQPAPEAIPQLRSLKETASGIEIMGGHGLSPDNIEYFIEATDLREVHFGSAVRYECSFRNAIDPKAMYKVRKILDNQTD